MVEQPTAARKVLSSTPGHGTFWQNLESLLTCERIEKSSHKPLISHLLAQVYHKCEAHLREAGNPKESSSWIIVKYSIEN